MNEVEMGMNRRSWTAIMDFAGLLGGEEQEELPVPRRTSGLTDIHADSIDQFNDIKLTIDPFLLACAIHVQTLRINMNYPGNGTRLGVISFQDLDLLNSIHLRDIKEKIAVSLSFAGLRVTDRTPGYSGMYDERCILQSENALKPIPKAKLDIVKYLGDADHSREWDLLVRMVVPKQMRLYYIHTHRYFCGLMDFWMQFFELQDLITKQKKKYVTEGPRSRVKLDIDIQSNTSLILPQNQLSDEVMVLTSTGIRILNNFKRMSALFEIFKNNGIIPENEEDIGNTDCLFDCLNANLADVELKEGKRIESLFRREEKNASPLGRDVFENFEFVVSNHSVFNKHFDLVTDVYRNLEGHLSKRFPDLSMITGIQGVTWYLTSDFYCLLRGFLSHNLGDPMIPQPDTIPPELLEKPEVFAEQGSLYNYTTLALRIFYENVYLECLVPQMEKPTNSKNKEPPSRLMRNGVHFNRNYEPLARIQMHSSKVSFDASIDGKSQFNVIGYNIQVEDTRTCPPAATSPAVHRVIVANRQLEADLSPLTVMAEAHILLTKDQPPTVTLVLQKSRVFVIPDFLFDAKDFVLLDSEFVRPVIEDPAPEAKPCGGLQPNAGVVDRLSTERPQQTFVLNLTLRESDLYFLENAWARNSFALVLYTSAVLKMNDAGGSLSADLEIEHLFLSWCLMDAMESTRSQCSKDFKLSVKLELDEKQEGLPAIMGQTHCLQVDVYGAIAKISFRDSRVLQVVLEGWIDHWTRTQGRGLVPQQAHRPPGKPLEIGKVVFNTDTFEIWFLDDIRRDGCVPLFRCILSGLTLRRTNERLVASFSINLDYFNQRVFGWDPFIEKWDILRFLMLKKEKLSFELLTNTKSTLDINLTHDLIHQAVQWKAQFAEIGQDFDRDEFRTKCSTRTRSDHLPYVLKNETGTDITFTMQVDELVMNRNAQQKPTTIKWLGVGHGGEQDFEFPTMLLSYEKSHTESRQLVIRVEGWDSCSPVNVYACGTYFRVIKSLQHNRPNARLVIRVTVEKDGKKVVAVRSSIEVHNSLPHQIMIYDENGTELLPVEPSSSAPIPLANTHTHFHLRPSLRSSAGEELSMARISWRNVRVSGEVVSQTVKLKSKKSEEYWLSFAVRREHYPENESLPGHTIYVVPPLTILNLLPVDFELRLQDGTYAIGAGKRLDVTTVDISREVPFSFTTDRLITSREYTINKASIADGQRIRIQLQDLKKRPLNVYADLKIVRGGAINVVFWVPFWVINKSGIPLVVKQQAAPTESAGQMEEHERAKDKHPLMFSFSESDCPDKCLIRVGQHYETEKGYAPEFSSPVKLSPGVQDVRLKLVHQKLPNKFYNIGVEVRAGTGRYKDTQVVLLTSRFILNNQSSLTLLVCHHEHIDRPSEHIHVAPGCNLVWNESYEDARKLCVRRADVKHWSCPFRIDHVGSFHITMRDADETPRFVRVEIIVSSAVFYVTFTDASYFPPPIQIENKSDVPVLYQQYSDATTKQHLRTICKANSTVDYAWDNPSTIQKLLLLQVYENKSHVYDPAIQGTGAALVYENNVFIQLHHSFKNYKQSKKTDECELVLETMTKGKVMLNKQNRLDGNGGNQLWKLCPDGCIENIGMNSRSKRGARMVLDVLETAGNQLMMCERSDSRKRFQNWTFLGDGRICCGVAGQYITARKTDVILMRPEQKPVEVNEDQNDVNQVWKKQTQRPGSGTLDVECFHNGPTLVVRITDRDVNRPLQANRSVSMPVFSERRTLAELAKPETCTEVSITMRSGIGVSLVNALHEELIYARLSDIAAHASKTGDTIQVTGSVGVIQVDNQLLCTDKWQVLYCHPDISPDEESPVPQEQLPAGVSAISKPALKLELKCTPMKHYDAFDCFRLKLCDMSVHLNEILLWKFVQFAAASDASRRVQPSQLELPPDTELVRPDPLASRRWYFGTLELDMGQILLSVVTVPKNGLPKDLRVLKQQFNIMLVSFENAAIRLPPFRQFHYFETSLFLLDLLRNFYFSELQKKVINLVFFMDAFGNPAGFVTDLKDSVAGLFIEGDFTRFFSGVGYGVSNSISKVASSMAAGVGAFTFDEEHEAKRRHNMLRSHNTVNSTPLGHLYSGVKGLGYGVMGIFSSIPTNTVQENKKSGFVTGTIRGVSTGIADMVTKPVQGFFDLVEGTAAAVREITAPNTVRRLSALSRVRPPRVCVDLYHQLPSYSLLLAGAQVELMRINGCHQEERLLDVENLIEQISADPGGNPRVIRQYALISTEQCYLCKQSDGESWVVTKRIAYKYVKSIEVGNEISTTGVYRIVVMEEGEDRKQRPEHIWCTRLEVAKRVAEKLQIAKNEYDHNKRTLREDV
ncbi:unnamed protein product, partial [Mesorhabditis spiculigera]